MTEKGFTLTHLTREGHAHMVDVGGKDVTARRATARGDSRARRWRAVQRLNDGWSPGCTGSPESGRQA